jgi:hypothetical protein
MAPTHRRRHPAAVSSAPVRHGLTTSPDEQPDPITERLTRTETRPAVSHRLLAAAEPTRARVRALLDRRGLCGGGVDPGLWSVVGPERTVLEREAAQVRARVLCAGCPVLALCRRTVLAVLSGPRRPGSRPVGVRGVWGGLAWWEVRAAVRRHRKARARASATRRPDSARRRPGPLPPQVARAA